MRTPFFITGLPRTRTAWLANLFTTGLSLCFHEPVETVQQLLDRYPDYKVGVSDSTLPFKLAELLERYPNAPWLYVERDEAEAKRSLIKFASPHRKLLGREVDFVFNAHRTAAGDIKKLSQTLVLPYAQLESRITEAWNHLLPGVQFDSNRYQVLCGFNVQQDWARAEAKRRA